jgi:hypothetical protein
VRWARIVARKLTQVAHRRGGGSLLGDGGVPIGGGSLVSNRCDGVVLQHEEGW